MNRKSLLIIISVVIICIVAVAAVVIANPGSEPVKPVDRQYYDDLKLSSIEYEVDGKKYDVYESKTHMRVDGYDFNMPFYYSDGYFASDSTKYNEHLASMTIALVYSGVNSGGSMEKQPAVFYELMQVLGCKNIYANDDYKKKPTETSIGVAFATKKVNVDGKEKDLVIIVPRSERYHAEWVNNVMIGTGSGPAKGFNDSAKKVLSELYSYLESNNIKASSDNTLFWITGFSRGAAVSNIVAKNIVDESNPTGERVFCYTFETPAAGTMDSLLSNRDYTGIHNLYDKRDLVPLVAPVNMGFIHYGVDHFVTNPVGKVEKIEIPVSGAGSRTSVKQLFDNFDKWEYGDNPEQYDRFCAILSNYFGSKEPGKVYINIFTEDMEFVKKERADVSIWNKSLLYSLQIWNDMDREKYAGGTVNMEECMKSILRAYKGDTPPEPEVTTILAFIASLYDAFCEIIGSDPGMEGEQLKEFLAGIKENYVYIESISEILGTTDEQSSYLCDIMLMFAYKDYTTTTEYYGVKGMAYIGTIVMHISDVMKYHYLPTPCAWVITYDSFYKNID